MRLKQIMKLLCIMISPFVKVYYFTLPIFLLDPPTDGVIRKDSCGQEKLLPSEGAMKNKSGLHGGWDGEDKCTHTTVRASLGMVFVMNGEKSKVGKQGLVFGPLVTEENSERNLHDRSFGRERGKS